MVDITGTYCAAWEDAIAKVSRVIGRHPLYANREPFGRGCKGECEKQAM